MDPLTRILSQAALEQYSDPLGSFGGEKLQVRLSAKNGRDGVGNILAAEGLLAGLHFIEDAPKGPDVRTPVDHFAASLFGAHVGGCSENDTRDSSAHQGW